MFDTKAKIQVTKIDSGIYKQRNVFQANTDWCKIARVESEVTTLAWNVVYKTWQKKKQDFRWCQNGKHGLDHVRTLDLQ